MDATLDFLKGFLTALPRPTIDTAYSAGYDSEMNGASEQNCHFTLFSSPEMTRAWDAGVREAKRVKAVPGERKEQR